MQLVSRGQRFGRRESHARDASAQALQGWGPVGVPATIEQLDDQPYPLVLPEPRGVDGLEDSLREDRFSDAYHASPFASLRLAAPPAPSYDTGLPSQRLGGTAGPHVVQHSLAAQNWAWYKPSAVTCSSRRFTSCPGEPNPYSEAVVPLRRSALGRGESSARETCGLRARSSRASSHVARQRESPEACIAWPERSRQHITPWRSSPSAFPTASSVWCRP